MEPLGIECDPDTVVGDAHRDDAGRDQRGKQTDSDYQPSPRQRKRIDRSFRVVTRS